MAIQKVWIVEGCTSCGVCESLCPDVFEMPDEARVIEGADFAANEECIIDSAESCPVEVIKYE
jgi:ferredoxin